MKKTVTTIASIMLVYPIFGASLDLPEFKLDHKIELDGMQPDIQFKVPELNIPPLTLLPNEKPLEPSQEEQLWETIRKLTPESHQDDQASTYQIYSADPFSGIILIPDSPVDERMVHQPAAGFESSMPVLSPEFKLHPSRNTKLDWPRSKQQK
jgi:hypothetical protein